MTFVPTEDQAIGLVRILESRDELLEAAKHAECRFAHLNGLVSVDVWNDNYHVVTMLREAIAKAEDNSIAIQGR